MKITKAQITKISRLLNKMPDDKYRQRNLTGDQMLVWMSHRISSEILARCWEALRDGSSDPLPFLVKKGVITPLEARFYKLEIQKDRFLWDLIYWSEQELKEVAARLELDYPFESVMEFFTHIIQKRAAKHFEGCLSYEKFSSFEHRTKIRKALRDSEAESPKRELLTDSHLKNAVSYLRLNPDLDFWLSFAWSVWDVLAQYPAHEDIKHYLANYDYVVAKRARLQAKALREMPSFAWVKGHKHIGQIGGSYKPSERSADPEMLEAYFDFNKALLPQYCDIS